MRLDGALNRTLSFRSIFKFLCTTSPFMTCVTEMINNMKTQFLKFTEFRRRTLY